MGPEQVSLQFHARTFEMAGATPAVSQAAVRLLEEREREWVSRFQPRFVNGICLMDLGSGLKSAAGPGKIRWFLFAASVGPFRTATPSTTTQPSLIAWTTLFEPGCWWS